MSVADLIRLLSNLPPDALVMHHCTDEFGYPLCTNPVIVIDDEGDVIVAGTTD